MLAFNLTMMAVHLAPEISPGARQLAALVWGALALAISAKMAFKIFV